MAITINEELVVASEQNYSFKSVTILKEKKLLGTVELKAIVAFDIIDQNGKVVSSHVIKYTGSDYNTFWTNFNSGKFLYEQLVLDRDLDIEVDNSIENDFLNG